MIPGKKKKKRPETPWDALKRHKSSLTQASWQASPKTKSFGQFGRRMDSCTPMQDWSARCLTYSDNHLSELWRIQPIEFLKGQTIKNAREKKEEGQKTNVEKGQQDCG